MTDAENLRSLLTNSCRSLRDAIGNADAVICAVGASSQFNPKAFEEVDRQVCLKFEQILY